MESNRLKWAPLFYITSIVIAVYYNTTNASWHMDDFVRILYNPLVHLNTIDWDALSSVAFSGSSTADRLYRPLPMISFALNWFFGQDSVRGYHIVNIVLHAITAGLLFYVVRLLLATPRMRSLPTTQKNTVALLAALFWSIHPLHTQAVTYIVQRMTVMAGLFYLSGVFCYMKSRLHMKNTRKGSWLMGCFLCFICALLSKENACLLPLSLLLMEYIFFRNDKDNGYSKKVIRNTCFLIVGLFVISAAILFGFMQKAPFEYISRLYDGRPFTPVERLLTESRVLIFYLSQIIYPSSNRLSIDHDLVISTSLFSPWTTLPACIMVIAIVALSWRMIRKHPIWAFAVLFFFLNHSIESTFLPLEPIFEHRNYIPSLFIFLPVSVTITRFLHYYRLKNRAIHGAIAALPMLLIIFFGTMTHERNRSWLTEESLWSDAMHKAPNQARPLANLALIAKQRGDYTKAIALNEKALSRVDWQGDHSRASVLNNLGNAYLAQTKFNLAETSYLQALQLWPEHESATFNLSMCRLWQKDYTSALKLLDNLIGRNPDNRLFLRRKAITLYKMGEVDPALFEAQRVLRQAPGDVHSIRTLGRILSLNGFYNRADWYFRNLVEHRPDDMEGYLDLIMNNLLWQREKTAMKNVQNLFKRFNLITILHGIKNTATNLDQAYYIEPEILNDALNRYLKEMGNMCQQADQGNAR